MKRIVSGLMLILLLVGMLTLAFNIHQVKASVTIYIRADGSVEPITAPISSVYNVTYVFTDNIYASIVVERDNIVVDGANYTVQGTGSGSAVVLTGRSNVTIKNMEIKGFYDSGIGLTHSSNNTISGNNITNNGEGIWLFQSSNGIISGNNIRNNGYGINGLSDFGSIYGNNITNNYDYGIYLGGSSNNNITANNIVGNGQAIWLWDSSNNNILRDNYVASNTMGGIYLGASSNTILNNTMTGNGYGVHVTGSGHKIIGNNITGNSDFGIYLSGQSNMLRANNMTKNKYNFKFYGWGELSNFINDIDASNTVEGKPIYYWVNKQDLRIPLDAGYVALVSCTRMVVQNLKLANNGEGVVLAFTTNSTITQNSIVTNTHGIILHSSSGNNIFINNITDNNAGTTFPNGIWLIYSSNNTISGNNIASNYDGIVFLGSSCNKIIGNNIKRSGRCGVYLSSSSDYHIFHNNFLNNHVHVYVQGYTSGANLWDNGYPSGGNYWDDYRGNDKKGLGYPPYSVGGDQDNYPLMGPISIFDVGVWNSEPQEIHVVSNSTVTDFRLDTSKKIVSFNVIGSDYTVGFCRATIPKIVVQDLWQSNYIVLVNGQPVDFINFTNTENMYIYFTYQHSEHGVTIVPEFSPFLILPLFMIATLLAVIVYRRKHSM